LGVLVHRFCLHRLTTIAAHQERFRLGPCVQIAGRTGELGLARRFFLSGHGGFIVSGSIVVQERIARRQVGDTGSIEATALLDHVCDLLAGFLAARLDLDEPPIDDDEPARQIGPQGAGDDEIMAVANTDEATAPLSGGSDRGEVSNELPRDIR
jgi:hypothetical protein